MMKKVFHDSDNIANRMTDGVDEEPANGDYAGCDDDLMLSELWEEKDEDAVKNTEEDQDDGEEKLDLISIKSQIWKRY